MRDEGLGPGRRRRQRTKQARPHGCRVLAFASQRLDLEAGAFELADLHVPFGWPAAGTSREGVARETDVPAGRRHWPDEKGGTREQPGCRYRAEGRLQGGHGTGAI